MSHVSNHLSAFESFTFDFAERVLRQGEHTVDLPVRTVDILGYLIENRDRWISKDELMTQFWPGVRVSVDSVHRQISDIRSALGDSAEDSRFVQTKYKVGWRFVANVTETVLPPLPSDASATILAGNSLTDARTPLKNWTTPRFATILLLLFLALALAAAFLFGLWPSPPPNARIVQSAQITWDGQEKAGPLLNNGRSIFFREGRRIMSVSIEGGDATPLVLDPPNVALRSITADGSNILLTSKNTELIDVWLYSVRAQKARRLVSSVSDAALSPDGQRLAVATRNDLHIQTLDGVVIEKASLGRQAVDLQWSPDGQTIRFEAVSFSGGLPSSIWEYRLGSSASATRLFSVTAPQQFAGPGVWSVNGKYFFYEAGRKTPANIWVNRERSFLPFRSFKPEILTSGMPGGWTAPAPVPGQDQSLFAINHYTRSELVRWDASAQSWEPIWNHKPVSELSYSPDGKWVVFVMLPDFSIWKAHPDGSASSRLTAGGKEQHQPHWSPDGSRVAYMGQNGQNQWAIFQVSAEGGVPEELATGEDSGVPTWSADGRSLIFGERLTKKPRAEMAIRQLAVASKNVSEMPGTRGLWSPRWSPDGGHILAVTSDLKTLRLRAWPTAGWRDLITLRWVDNATWSSDSRYIYFNGADAANHRWFFRFSIVTNTVERITGLDDFKVPQEVWFGVDQNGIPLASRDATVDEIFKLKCELP